MSGYENKRKQTTSALFKPQDDNMSIHPPSVNDGHLFASYSLSLAPFLHLPEKKSVMPNRT